MASLGREAPSPRITNPVAILVHGARLELRGILIGDREPHRAVLCFGVETGAIGVDLARSFLAGSDLVVANPTFFSFRVVF